MKYPLFAHFVRWYKLCIVRQNIANICQEDRSDQYFDVTCHQRGQAHRNPQIWGRPNLRAYLYSKADKITNGN